MFRVLFLSLLLFSCKSIAPTPLLIGDLVRGNDEVHTLYLEYRDCKEINPTNTCGLPQLKDAVMKVQEAAKQVIAADIIQPHGYDIYLQITLIYFSVSEANKNELTEAERISRQFFEIQKASSGRALDDARYYWALVLSETISHDLGNARFIELQNRRPDIILCLSEATIALNKLEQGPKLVRLFQAIQILTIVSSAL